MSGIPLISQGDGFVYNALLAGMGASFTGSNVFTWPGPNVWVPVPFNAAMTGSGPPPFQYMTADGGFRPPIAGWWNVMASGRCYAGPGLWSHYMGLFVNAVQPENLILQTGGNRQIQTQANQLMYFNGTDTLYMGFLTTKTGVSTRNFSSSQTYVQAYYVRP